MTRAAALLAALALVGACTGLDVRPFEPGGVVAPPQGCAVVRERGGQC